MPHGPIIQRRGQRALRASQVFFRRLSQEPAAGKADEPPHPHHSPSRPAAPTRLDFLGCHVAAASSIRRSTRVRCSYYGQCELSGWHILLTGTTPTRLTLFAAMSLLI